MIHKALAWVQIFVIVAGGLIAWGRMTAQIDSLKEQLLQQHDELMQQISQENARILAIEQEVFRVYADTAPDSTRRHGDGKKAPRPEP